MAKLIELGPTFTIERRAIARRWQVYAARSLFVAGLLTGLALAFWVEGRQRATIRGSAQAGYRFFAVISMAQLALVLLAGPAATAGSVCVDGVRGALAHLLVTDLTGAEILLGKLAARLVTVLGLIVSGLPVMVLAIPFGGVDPEALVAGTLIAAATAVLACSLALTFSVWAIRTDEVLLATYAVMAVWLGTGPGWVLFNRIGWLTYGPPGWLMASNPVLLIARYVWSRGGIDWLDVGRFLVGSVPISAMLTTSAIAFLRPAAARRLDRPRRRRRESRARRWPGPSLEGNPVLWLEWHRRRPRGWIRLIWIFYELLALGATATMVTLVVRRGLGQGTAFASLLNGVQVAAGMLLLVVTSTTSLAEERMRGSWDVLLTSPLETRSIVLGKWWGAFRSVPRLAILPALAAFAVACRSGRFEGVALIAGLVISYGAALASLGLALATWVPNAGRAATLGVAVHVIVTVGFFLVGAASTPGSSGFLGPGLALASPFVGVTFIFIEMQGIGPGTWPEFLAWLGFWIIVELAAAGILLAATLMTFDRCMGRIISVAGPRLSRSIRAGEDGNT